MASVSRIARSLFSSFPQVLMSDPTVGTVSPRLGVGALGTESPATGYWLLDVQRHKTTISGVVGVDEELVRREHIAIERRRRQFECREGPGGRSALRQDH